MKDERIEQAKNKIKSEVTEIIFFIVMISLLIKIIFLDLDFKDCITEYIIIVIIPVYQLIRMHMLKISIYQEKKQSLKNIIIIMAILIVTSALMIYKNYKTDVNYDWIKSARSILIFVVLYILLYFVTNRYNKYRGNKYEREYDDKENK